MKRLLVFLLTISACCLQAWAQTPAKGDTLTINLEMAQNDIPTLELNPGIKSEKVRKPKKRKNVYWDLPVKRLRVREVNRKGDITYEFFSILTDNTLPDRFADEKYFYDPAKKRIQKTDWSDARFGVALHGPYVKTVNGDTVVVGQFYKGVKTGRWEAYGPDLQLQDKKYYYRGYPKESKITYYDPEQKKVREVIPYQHGELEGTYLRYYPSGRPEERGVYKDGAKIGRWTTYYDRYRTPQRDNRKQEMQYDNSPHEPRKAAYVLREWNEEGKTIVDNSRQR